jgi:HD-like signal output (HDOD) protein
MQLPEWMCRRKDGPGAAGRPVLETLKANVGSLSRVPTLPEAATRAMAVAKDPNSSLATLAAVIERDPALAAGLLKLANSPLYRTGRAVETLHQAVVKVGARECQNLVLAVGMRSLFRKVPRARQRRFEGLWRHSFLTACVCRQLNQALRLDYQGEEFACGLAHDIGRLLIGLGAPELSDAVDPMDFVEGPEVLAREQTALGTDHCYFGAWFANANNLPATLVRAIQFHHTPDQADEHPALVALVAAADHMANYFQRAQRFEGYDAAANPAWPLLGAPDEVAEAVMAEALREAEEVLSVAA